MLNWLWQRVPIGRCHRLEHGLFCKIPTLKGQCHEITVLTPIYCLKHSICMGSLRIGYKSFVNIFIFAKIFDYKVQNLCIRTHHVVKDYAATQVFHEDPRKTKKTKKRKKEKRNLFCLLIWRPGISVWPKKGQQSWGDVILKGQCHEIFEHFFGLKVST